MKVGHGSLPTVWRCFLVPTPLDCGLRRVAEISFEGRCRAVCRIGVRSMLSWQALIPAGAGTPRYEDLDGLLETSGRPLCHPLRPWIPAFAGMTIREIGETERHNRNRAPSFSYQSLILAGSSIPRYEKWVRWLAGLLYGGSGLGLVAGPPGAGDKPLALRSLRPRYIFPSLWLAAPNRVTGCAFNPRDDYVGTSNGCCPSSLLMS